MGILRGCSGKVLETWRLGRRNARSAQALASSVHLVRVTRYHRKAGTKAHQHLIRGAPQSERAHDEPPLHPADEWLLKETRKSRGFRCSGTSPTTSSRFTARCALRLQWLLV